MKGREKASTMRMAVEYARFVSSWEPEPRDLLQAICTPALSTLATAPMASSTGLASS